MTTPSTPLFAEEAIRKLEETAALYQQRASGVVQDEMSMLWIALASLAKTCADQEQRLQVLGPCCDSGEPGDHKWNNAGWGRTCENCGATK